MTRGKKLGALVLVLVLLCGVTWAVRGMNDKPAAESAEQTYVLTEALADVTEISWHYGDGVLSFVKTAEGGWAWPEDAAFPVSNAAMANLLSALGGMTAEKVISPVEDLGEYGLDRPVCTVVLNGRDRVSFGGVNALGDAQYVTTDGSTVYLTDKSVVTNFNVGLYDLLRTESIPFMHHVTDVTVVRASGEDLVLRAETVDGKSVWHGLRGSEELTLDKALAEDFADTVTGIYWGDCVAYDADAKALRNYGLDVPAAVLTVGYTESEQVATALTDDNGLPIYETVTKEFTFVLELGKEAVGGVYARLPDSGMVYVLPDSFAEDILHLTLEELLPYEE